MAPGETPSYREGENSNIDDVSRTKGRLYALKHEVTAEKRAQEEKWKKEDVNDANDALNQM